MTRTYVAIDIAFVKCIVGRQVLLKIPNSNRIVTRASDKTIRRHSIDRVLSGWIHFNAPYAGRMIQEGMRFSNSSYVLNVPNVDTVVVVYAGEFVIALVESQSYGIRIPCVRWMLRHVTENANECSCYGLTIVVYKLSINTHFIDNP